MRIKNILVLLFLFYSFSIYSQNMAVYTSGWEGKIENTKIFNLQIEIENLGLANAKFRILNHQTIIDYAFDSNSTSILEIPFAKNHSFKGRLSKNGKTINGFIKSGMLLYHLKLTQTNKNTFIGTWNLLMIDELKSLNFYLSVENGDENNYQAYPIFGDNRFTGTWCDDFQKENDSISFTDYKTGLQFKGKLLPNSIALGIYLGKNLITTVTLKKSTTDWEIGGFQNENKASILPLTKMESLILTDSLPNTHSVLVSKNGRVIYENYFDGYTASIPHDMRSASKSISSAIVGIASDKSLFTNVEQSIFDFLPNEYQILKDTLKSKIDIQSLLTMSSGLDADDYTSERKSPASENNYQPTRDWTETILKAKMINKPNTEANYGSANPYLLGVTMDSIVSEPLELFIDKNLFQKLEISNYIIQTDLKGRPYFGGGMYLTPKDMLKFGELYLNEGTWKSKRILSKKWVENSFKNYRNLDNVPHKNGYGYLWWHHKYQLNGKQIESIEARGAGGQYIFVIPGLKIVVVITSGNYRNRKTQQPEKIFQEYILPYLEN